MIEVRRLKWTLLYAVWLPRFSSENKYRHVYIGYYTVERRYEYYFRVVKLSRYYRS